MRTPNGNTKEQVAMKIANYLTTKKDVPLNTTLDATYKDDLGFTDVDIWELILFLEQEFDLNISDQQASLIKTIQNSFDICFTQLIEQVDVNGFRTTIGIDWRDNFNWESLTNGIIRNSEYTPGGNSTTAVVLAAQTTIDLKKRLDCFLNIIDNANTKYKVTLHVQLADPNYPSIPIVSDGSVGHAYLTLEKSNEADKHILSFGFYPKESSTSVPLKNSVLSGMGEESSNTTRRSDISYTIDVNKSTFDAVINQSIQNSSLQYNLSGYNCTDYAVDVFNQTIPNHRIDVSGYTTPSDLYSKMRALSSTYPIQRNLNGWNNPRAPISSNPCK